MSKFRKFFKKIKGSSEQSKNEEKTIEKTNNNNNNKIHIQIDGDIGLFKDEKQKIIEGAKQLLELGKCNDMVDAIITFATMFRGLKFREVKKTEEGEIVIVLKETAQELKSSFYKDEEIGDR